MDSEQVHTKVANTTGGLSLYHNNRYHPCDSLMASMFLGNDDHSNAYCVAGGRINKRVVNGRWVHDNEYHLFDEISGRLSPEFIASLKSFLQRNRIDRVILLCSDEDLRNRIRKELGCRFIFEEEKKRKNASIILREWFSRNKSGTEDSVLKVWGDCREAIKSNYPPTRECIVKLLDWYDKRAKRVNSIPKTLSIRAGYG